jgi:hypothetical protein
VFDAMGILRGSRIFRRPESGHVLWCLLRAKRVTSHSWWGRQLRFSEIHFCVYIITLDSQSLWALNSHSIHRPSCLLRRAETFPAQRTMGTKMTATRRKHRYGLCLSWAFLLTWTQQAYKTEKDAILFAIDISSSMLRPAENETGDRDSATMAALKCAYRLMQQRIISNPGDMMGILLFGTEESKTGDDADSDASMPFPHCYLLTQLDVPGASDVRCIRDLVQDEEEAKKLLVPSNEPVSIASVLFCCNHIFTTRAANFASRRLFLVTDNDNPHGSDNVLRSAAAVRAKDLYDLGVFIELFPIAQPGAGFEREKFYDVGLSAPDNISLRVTGRCLSLAPARWRGSNAVAFPRKDHHRR